MAIIRALGREKYGEGGVTDIALILLLGSAVIVY